GVNHAVSPSIAPRMAPSTIPSRGLDIRFPPVLLLNVSREIFNLAKRKLEKFSSRGTPAPAGPENDSYWSTATPSPAHSRDKRKRAPHQATGRCPPTTPTHSHNAHPDHAPSLSDRSPSLVY